MQFWISPAFIDDPSQLPAIARAAEEAGYTGITLSDHVLYPRDLSSPYPYSPDGSPPYKPETPWPDVWVTIGAMAAVTERLRFMTNVYILPLRNVFVTAKAVSTASVLSGGRVALGVGAGWCAEEFALLDEPFERRGARMAEMVEAMRALFRGGMQGYHGDHVDFAPVQLSPVPRGPVPVYFGGVSDVALRRTARLGDGWLGLHHTADELAALLSRLGQLREDAGRADDPFTVVAGLAARPDPAVFASLADQGLDGTLVVPWLLTRDDTSSLDAKIESLHRFADRVIAQV